MTDHLSTGLVPPRRLGTLLASARAGRGKTLDQVAEESAGRFSKARIASIERGTVDADDQELVALAALYGLETSSLIPDRSRLELDVAEGVLRTQIATGRFDPQTATAEEVLPRYLAMVYAMRGAALGSRVPLRIEDLDVLGTALHLRTDRIHADLDALMASPDPQVGRAAALLSRRVLVPAAGVLVAFCGVGALILASADAPPDPASRPDTGVTTAPDPALVTGPGGAVEADIGEAVVQERDASGSTTPVQPRSVDDGPTPP